MDTSLTVSIIGEGSESPIVLRLRGPVLISNLSDFQAHVREVNAQDLILDMTEVPYIDSSGVGVLVGAYVHRQKEGRNLILVGVQERVRATLRLTQVERFFTFANAVAS